jgi:hypothetical protein
MMGVTHEPETYARHRQGLVVWLERVLWITGFSMNSVKLSTRVTRSSLHYCCSTVKLVVMPDLAVRFSRRNGLQLRHSTHHSHPVSY